MWPPPLLTIHFVSDRNVFPGKQEVEMATKHDIEPIIIRDTMYSEWMRTVNLCPGIFLMHIVLQALALFLT